MAEIEITGVDDGVYFAKRSGLYMAGKTIVTQVEHVAGETISEGLGEETVRNIGSMVPAFISNNAAVLLGVGLAAGISAGLTQMDYNRKIDHLKDKEYAEELSVKLGKPAKKLTRSDLDVAGNRTISEQVAKIKRQRNFGVFFSFTASLASMAVIKLALPVVLSALFPGLPPMAPSLLTDAAWTLGGMTTIAISAAVGLGTYLSVKKPLHWLGDKLFGLDKETTHDRIVSLKRDREAGREITREQILSVFASAIPQVDQAIASEYGERFDTLSAPDKQRAAQELSQFLPLEALAQKIKTGEVNVMELAFAVEGDVSGVEHYAKPAQQKPHGIFGALAHRLKSALGRGYAEPPDAPPSPQRVTVIYEQNISAKPFVDKVGRKANTGVYFADRVSPQAVEVPVAPKR